MKAFFWQAGEDGSSFYRQTLPSLGLGWLGHKTVASQQLTSAVARDMDVIVGARVAMPAAVEAWATMADAGKALVLDLDDDYFCIDSSNLQAKEFWSPLLLGNLERTMGLATVVTAVSEPLAGALRQHTDTPVVVIPNGLPAQYLNAPRVYEHGGAIVVGWAGSSSTLHELPKVARALRRLIDTYPDRVRVKLVGCTLEEAAAKGLKGPGITATGWIRTTQDYLKACMEFDVWVAPYRRTPYNEHKFATKALEAGMLGIPLIASNTRPYADWVWDNGPACGVDLVSEDFEWSRKLLRFVQSADLREMIGLDATAAASAYSLQSLAFHWETVLKDAIRKAGKK